VIRGQPEKEVKTDKRRKAAGLMSSSKSNSDVRRNMFVRCLTLDLICASEAAAAMTKHHHKYSQDLAGAPPFPPPNPRAPKQDSERPNSALWWLAGGKRSRGGQVPTIGELRVRKEVEEANRQIVGFWGTVVGLRRVGRVGLLDGGGNGSGGEGEGEGGDRIGEVGERGSVASVKSVSVRTTSARSVDLEGDRAVGGDDGDKPDGGEAVADSIGSGGGGGSVKDQSVNGGSAKSVEKCEAAQEESQGDNAEKAVDGHDVAEESTSVRDNDRDDHSGETEVKEAVEAAEDGHEKKSVDNQDVAEASNSVKSQKEDNDQDEHSGETEAREAVSAVGGEDAETPANGNGAAEESNSVKSQKEDRNQDEHSGEMRAKEAAEAADEEVEKTSVDGKDVAEESDSAKLQGDSSNLENEHSHDTEAREDAEAAGDATDPVSPGVKESGV
jgi:hypothetical protein